MYSTRGVLKDDLGEVGEDMQEAFWKEALCRIHTMKMSSLYKQRFSCKRSGITDITESVADKQQNM